MKGLANESVMLVEGKSQHLSRVFVADGEITSLIRVDDKLSGGSISSIDHDREVSNCWKLADAALQEGALEDRSRFSVLRIPIGCR